MHFQHLYSSFSTEIFIPLFIDLPLRGSYNNHQKQQANHQKTGNGWLVFDTGQGVASSIQAPDETRLGDG